MTSPRERTGSTHRLRRALLAVVALAAALGQPGNLEGKNDVGVAIHADLRPVAGSAGWLAAELGWREGLEGRPDWLAGAGLVVGLVALLAATLYLLRRRQAKLLWALHEAERWQRQAEEAFRIPLLSIGDGVITSAPGGLVREMNPAAERLTGWSEAEASGRHLAEVLRFVDAATGAAPGGTLDARPPDGAVAGPTRSARVVARDGTQRSIAYRVASLGGGDAAVGGVLVFREVAEPHEAQQALRESEQHLRAIIETEPECVKVLDRDGGLVEMNAAGLAMLEAESLAEVQRRTLVDFVLPEHRAAFRALCERVLSGESGRLEFEISGLKGARRWLETNAAPLRDATGGVAALLGITRDITERKRLEQERESERSTLELLAGGAPLPAALTHLALSYEARFPGALCSVLLLDEDGKRLRHGAAPSLPVAYCEALDGLEIGPAVGSCGTAAYNGRTTIVADIASDPLWRDFRELALAHGLSACWSVPIHSARGRVLGTFAVYYRVPRAPQPAEVTAIERSAFLASLAIERRRAEEALQVSEDRYRDLVENSQDLICTHDLEGKLLSVNEVASRLTGYPLETQLGTKLSDLLPPETRHLFAAYLTEIRATGRARGTMQIRTASGETRYWEYRSTLRTEGVAVPVVRCAARDVTEEVLAKQSLKRSERRYRELFERNLAGVYRTTLDGELLDCNEACAGIYGYPSRADAMRMSAADLHPSAEARRQFLTALQVAGTLVNVESRGRRKDGSLIWLLENASLIADEKGDLTEIVGTLVDITERKRAEETLRLQSAALDAAANAIVITDRDGTIAWVNRAFAELTGYSAEEAIGRNPRDLVRSGVHGREFYQQMWETILAGQVWRGELTNRRKDGTRYPERQSITPVRDARGEIGHFIAIKWDLTEQKRLETEFLQAQKMETVGRLAGGIAHDFNNLLTVISGAAELASASVSEGDPLDFELQEIRKAAERAAALTRQLLAFSRKQIMKPEVLSLSQMVLGMQGMLQRLIGEDIDLDVVATEAGASVLADPGQIEQVIMNLAVNARDAMPAGGKLTIATQEVELDEAEVAAHPPLRPGPHVLLSVGDTGIGMDEETRARLFEPFFTTKEVGKGTGLGLATVYGIVRQSGGSIGVDSDVLGGTTFEIYLPRVEKTANEDRPAGTEEGRPGSETILVVEDQEALRELTTRMLRSAGYRVIPAGDGEEALLLLERHDGPLHLVLTDVVLPGINGRDLATRIAQARPEAEILYTSGYTDDAVLRHGVLDKAVHFIAKPFTVAELRRKVRELLDA